MNWELNFAKFSKFWERLERRGRKRPVEPELEEEAIPFWNAFWALHLSRPAALSVQAIPLQALLAWLDINQINDLEERQDHVRFVQAMDLNWLNTVRETKKKQPDADTPDHHRRTAGKSRSTTRGQRN